VAQRVEMTLKQVENVETILPVCQWVE